MPGLPGFQFGLPGFQTLEPFLMPGLPGFQFGLPLFQTLEPFLMPDLSGFQFGLPVFQLRNVGFHTVLPFRHRGNNRQHLSYALGQPGHRGLQPVQAFRIGLHRCGQLGHHRRQLADFLAEDALSHRLLQLRLARHSLQDVGEGIDGHIGVHCGRPECSRGILSAICHYTGAAPAGKPCQRQPKGNKPRPVRIRQARPRPDAARPGR